MSIEAMYKQNAGQEDYTPSVARLSGEILQGSDGKARVVKADLAADEKGAVYKAGIFDILAASGTTFAIGERVYWDSSASLAIAAGSCGDADIYLGIAVSAKASGTTRVRIDLNAVVPERMAFSSRAVSIEHDDTDEHILIDAEQNVGGLALIALLGEVTEQPAGSSEDQLIITLYDSDDSAIDTLTTSATPDAIGDIIVGATSMFTTATGGIFKKIPAGKGAYAKVTQATAGGTPAGAVTCRVLVCPLI